MPAGNDVNVHASIDMAEFHVMRNLMIRVRDEAKGIRHLLDKVLSNMKQSDGVTEIIKGKERKTLLELIAQTEDAVRTRFPLVSKQKVILIDIYGTYREEDTVVGQYNQELAELERIAQQRQRPAEKERPPDPRSARGKMKR